MLKKLFILLSAIIIIKIIKQCNCLHKPKSYTIFNITKIGTQSPVNSESKASEITNKQLLWLQAELIYIANTE